MRKSEWGIGEFGSLNAEVGIIRFQIVDCGLMAGGKVQLAKGLAQPPASRA